MDLTEALKKRYHRNDKIYQAVIDLCHKHLKNNLADANAAQKLASDNLHTFWQQFSEVLLADQLIKAGIKPIHQATGPDFLIEQDGKRIWIEVITPEPTGIPDEWINYEMGKAVSMPHESILLRWTAAIKQKAEVLLGGTDKIPNGYIAKNIVAPSDAYVIAINGRLLRAGLPQIEGISQFPFAVEATFCVGPYQLHIDRNTLKTTGSGHQHRNLIPKPKGAPVPTDTFLDPQYAPISAIWAVDIDEALLIGIQRPMVVVHNPNASEPIPRSLLPAYSEYVASDQGEHYQLDRLSGRLSAEA
jgi:type I restriction enzyme S subunit